jgi:zinc protease
VQQRLFEKLLPEILPGSRLARRLPIGREETVARLQRQDFVAYYSTWYHPAKVTLLAVGDAPVDTIVAAITGAFGAWQQDAAPPADHDPAIQPYQAPHAVIVTDPELTSASVEMLALYPGEPRRTVGDFRQRVVERLGTWMMNRRMEQRIQEGTAPYQSARTGASRFLGVARQIDAEAEAAPQAWAAALQGLLTDVQQARLHGFTERELAVAKQALLATAEHEAQIAQTQDAHVFLAAMNRARAADELPLSAEQTVDLLRQLLPGISRDEVVATFIDLFEPQKKAYILSLPENGPSIPSREAFLAAVQEALAQPVAPWQDRERPAALLAQVPAPGPITEQTHFAPLQVMHVTFANNVRLHYRFMDFKKDHVTVAITLPGGVIREQPEQRGITAVAALPLEAPATSRLSSTDIRDLMTGKKVSVQGRVTADTLTLTVSGTPTELEDGLQLAHLLLLDARIEPARVALWQHQKLQEVAAIQTQIRTRAHEAAALALSGDDPRHMLLTAEQITTRAAALAEAQTWLDTILRTAPMEVAIVGDMPEQTALTLAATYLGSLPSRPRADPSLTPLRSVAGFTGPLTRAVDVDTITPRAHPILMWRSAPWEDVQGRRLMYLASQILERRVRQEVREQRGLTYSTSTYTRPSKTYPAMSALYVEFTADPDKVDTAAAVAKAVVEQFATEGPTDTEVDTVRKQIRNSMETAMKEPGYWVELLATLEYHHTRLEDVDGLVDKLTALSREAIAAEIRKAVVPERFAMVIARPTPAAVSSETPSTTPPPNAVQ